MQFVEAHMRSCEAYEIVGGMSEAGWKSKVTESNSGPFTVTFRCYLKNSATAQLKIKIRIEAVMIVKSTSSHESWTFVGTRQHGSATHHVRGVFTPGQRTLRGGFWCEVPDNDYHTSDSRLIPALVWMTNS